MTASEAFPRRIFNGLQCQSALSYGDPMPKTPDKPPLSLVAGETAVISPPRPLGPHGASLWQRVQAEYGIRDTGGIELLAQACQALDRAEALADAIARDGATIYSRTGVPKTHPSVKDELALRAFIVKTLERLGLNVETIQRPGRPTKSSSWRGDVA